MVIKVKSLTSQCYTNRDGDKVYNKLYTQLLADNDVELSFEGVDVVTSSFVNSALIELLNSFGFEKIKNHVRITDSNSFINRSIKERFAFEVDRLQD